MKRVLAVASGKGGVGKTWFAITLSQALARMNKRVLLVDCDIGLANVDVQLGMAKGVDLMTVAMGQTTLSKAARSIDGLGFDVLPGRSSSGRVTGLDTPITGWIKNQLRSSCDQYDFVILDLPSGVDQGIRDLMRYADDDVMVTTGEPTALADAYALIKATRTGRQDATPKLVVNFAENETAGRQTLDGLVRVCNRFLSIRPSGLGIVRRDAKVPEAIGRQAPLLTCHPRSDAAQDVIAVARAVVVATERS